jgi:hypothetical protein
MLAKSFSRLFSTADAGKAQRTRIAVSILALVAGLAILPLLLFQNSSRSAEHAERGLFSSLEVFKPAAQAGGASQAASVDPDAERHRVLAEFLSKRYKVSKDVTLDLVGIAHAAGHQLGLDPLLIMAMIAVESRYNPIAESVAGAKGLMQIIPKYHADKLDGFGGEKAVFDPATNILVGAQILKEYLGRTGNLSMALQMYAGALNDQEDVYTNRVMGEKQRLQRALGQHASPGVQATSASSNPVSRSAPL